MSYSSEGVIKITGSFDFYAISRIPPILNIITIQDIQHDVTLIM